MLLLPLSALVFSSSLFVISCGSTENGDKQPKGIVVGDKDGDKSKLNQQNEKDTQLLNEAKTQDEKDNTIVVSDSRVEQEKNKFDEIIKQINEELINKLKDSSITNEEKLKLINTAQTILQPLQEQGAKLSSVYSKVWEEKVNAQQEKDFFEKNPDLKKYQNLSAEDFLKQPTLFSKEQIKEINDKLDNLLKPQFEKLTKLYTDNNKIFTETEQQREIEQSLYQIESIISGFKFRTSRGNRRNNFALDEEIKKDRQAKKEFQDRLDKLDEKQAEEFNKYFDDTAKILLEIRKILDDNNISSEKRAFYLPIQPIAYHLPIVANEWWSYQRKLQAENRVQDVIPKVDIIKSLLFNLNFKDDVKVQFKKLFLFSKEIKQYQFTTNSNENLNSESIEEIQKLILLSINPRDTFSEENWKEQSEINKIKDKFNDKIKQIDVVVQNKPEINQLISLNLKITYSDNTQEFIWKYDPKEAKNN